MEIVEYGCDNQLENPLTKIIELFDLIIRVKSVQLYQC